jgi:hypothetical protein
VKLALLVPEFTPLTFHWYEGVSPPFVGVAVKVTGMVAQTGLAEAMIDTLTGRLEFTVIVTVFDVAGLPVAQVASEVRITVTWSLLTGVYVKLTLLVPAFTPFTCH